MKLNQFRKTALQTRIGVIRGKEERLSWLLDLGISANKVINFGCSGGTDTLALMCFLDSNEGVGLDIDNNAIDQAGSIYRTIYENVQYFKRMMQLYPHIFSEDDKAWWSKVPQFFKQSLFRDTFRLAYIVQNITQPSSMPSNYFDIAFSDFVLHHIWYDENSDTSLHDTFKTIQEMTRVIKPGGLVASFELVQYANKPKLDFDSLFLKAGLEQVHLLEYETQLWRGGTGIVGEYCYRKARDE